MRFLLKAPDISYAGNQKLLKPLADSIIGDPQKVGFQLIRYTDLGPSKECQSRREPSTACRIVGKPGAIVGPTPEALYQLD